MDLKLLKEKNAFKKGPNYGNFGGYFEQGEVKKCLFVASDKNGHVVPMQSEARAFWPDGSIKWTKNIVDVNLAGDEIKVMPVASTEQEIKDLVSKEQGNLFGTKDENLVRETPNDFLIDTGKLALSVPKEASDYVARDIYCGNRKLANSIRPVFALTRVEENKGEVRVIKNRVYGRISRVSIEGNGPIAAILKIEGNNILDEDFRMPFIVRLYVYKASSEIKFTYTLVYDGVEERDRLGGMGLEVESLISGNSYNKHIKIATDGPMFHEFVTNIDTWYPKIGRGYIEKQVRGEILEKNEDLEVEKDLPHWNNYSVYQDSAYHYRITKNTQSKCCSFCCFEGKRTSGATAISGENGGIILAIRDFWQKYPSEVEIKDFGSDINKCYLWFYSPKAESFDFSHYDTRGYARTCYEGFERVGASAFGIGVTSECSILFTEENAVLDGDLTAFSDKTQYPPVYVADPEYYHDKKAFGYWSLPSKKINAEIYLEDQLDRAFEFYLAEREQRNWYGLFDYGDVMHTYDGARHKWKYDVGGYAWDNTELVPTLWLWLYFMRTGRADVYRFAEALSRHTSEVDIYHMGALKGLGSRHNVRHWGCSCKEPRISMAGHHRFIYYLSGDERYRDVFEEVKDADFSMENVAECHSKDETGEIRLGVRSGPDWSSFVSNWMTWYEITLDEAYLNKIKQGINDIAETPYGFYSGPDYYYDVKKSKLIYHGEIEGTPNQHLQICMGGPQIWLECGDMMDDARLREMLVKLGQFYLLDKEEKSRLTNGLVHDRAFSWPMFATGIVALAAQDTKDAKLAEQAWEILIQDLKSKNEKGYEQEEFSQGFFDIPWITTNEVAQWCLNTIMCLEFIREDLDSI